jgi:antitoxin component YwqK of YwqJK toxin-antitoxin module
MLASISYAQVGDTLYFDSEHVEIASRDGATYYRVVKDYDAAHDNFAVVEFYTTGEKILEAQMPTVNGNFYNGSYLFYHKNGALRIKGSNRNVFERHYENEEELWYPNGALQGNTSSKHFDYIFHNLYDSLGKQEVKDGNGRCTFISYRDSMVEQGQITDGLREGRWLVRDFSGQLIAKENYKNGRLTKGYRMLDQTDSTLYKDYGSGDNAAITKRLERQIKKQIKAQLPKRLGIKKDIYYAMYIKENHIWKVQLLRDKFMIDHNIRLTTALGAQSFVTFIRDETPDKVEVWSMRFKMSL